MQERDEHFHPLNICHMLFNFIMNSLVARGLKGVSFGHQMANGTIEPPVEVSITSGEPGKASMSAEGKAVIRPALEKVIRYDSSSTSETKVHSKHSKGLENWSTANDELASPVPASKKDQGMDTKKEEKSPAMQNGSKQPHKDHELPTLQEIGVFNGISLSLVQDTTDSQVRAGEGKQEAKPKSEAVASRERGPKRGVNLKHSAEDKGKMKVVEGDKPGERLMSTKDSEEVILKVPRHGKLLNVVPNINEKSDEFIRSRKEAMRMH